MNLNVTIKDDIIMLRPLKEEDIEQLRVWRNNKENSVYLSKIGYITEKQQKKWFEMYEKNSTNYTFAICELEENEEIIGSVSICLVENEYEIAKLMIGSKAARGKGFGYRTLILLSHIIFDILNADSEIIYTYKENIPAMKNNIKIGFTTVEEYEKEGKVESKLRLNRDKFMELYGNTKKEIFINE